VTTGSPSRLTAAASRMAGGRRSSHCAVVATDRSARAGDAMASVASTAPVCGRDSAGGAIAALGWSPAVCVCVCVCVCVWMPGGCSRLRVYRYLRHC